MSNKIGRPNLEVFAETLLIEAKKNPNIMVATSDSRGSGKLVLYGKELPKQIIEVGIAEQNLVGVSAGLSAVGKKVFAVSPASFLTARSLEQIKADIAYSDHPVCLIGISAGISYGQLGSTHHSIHDYAVLRCINNISIVAPADNFETSEVIKQAVNFNSPLYLRFGKKPMMDISNENKDFKIGKAKYVTKGEDVLLIAAGETVQRAYLAAQLLSEKNIHATVISMHTIKPFDAKTFLTESRKSKVIISIEEHSIYGGLGEQCASLLAQHNINAKFQILGIPDEYMINGTQSDVLDYYNMSPEKIYNTVISLLAK
ncbi:transketolase family protein [Alphaproteobacteria bacterium]|jgi:transketolase|nr:transketolase family protein [Alphaproteobacteria bacterium]MDB3973731.1 transketolase family protein [Alphaproteobacteria bacterium]